MKRLLIGMILVAVLVSACGDGKVSPTPTPTEKSVRVAHTIKVVTIEPNIHTSPYWTTDYKPVLESSESVLSQESLDGLLDENKTYSESDWWNVYGTLHYFLYTDEVEMLAWDIDKREWITVLRTDYDLWYDKYDKFLQEEQPWKYTNPKTGNDYYLGS